MKKESTTHPTKELSPRYYIAEGSCWSLGGILLACRFFGIAPDQQLPFLNITPTDSLGFIRIVGVLLVAAGLYLLIEWKQSEQSARDVTGRVARLLATFAWILLSLWFAYPLLAQGTEYAMVSGWWFLAFILNGTIMGMVASVLIYPALTIRSREEAMELHLPRIPIPAKASFAVLSPLFLVMVVLFFVLLAFAPSPMYGLSVFLAGAPFLYFICEQFASLYLAKNNKGERIPFEEQIKGLKEANNAYDYAMFLSESGDRLTRGLGVKPTDSPQQVQEAVREHFSDTGAKNGNINFKVRADEEFSIQAYSKDGNPANDIPSNVGLNIEAERTGMVKVTLMPDDSRLDSKKMEIPLVSIESYAEEFLAGRSKIKKDTILKAVNYAMNQAATEQLIEQIQSPLLAAANTGDKEAVDFLLRHGDINVNEKGAFGWTALQFASANGHLDLVKRLLEAGANPDLANVKGMNALLYAARYGNLETCSLLLDYGADVNIQDVTRMSALHYATSAASLEVVDLLLTNGADFNLKNIEQKSALDIAYETKQGEIAKKIKQASK